MGGSHTATAPQPVVKHRHCDQEHLWAVQEKAQGGADADLGWGGLCKRRRVHAVLAPSLLLLLLHLVQQALGGGLRDVPAAIGPRLRRKGRGGGAVGAGKVAPDEEKHCHAHAADDGEGEIEHARSVISDENEDEGARHGASGAGELEYAEKLEGGREGG